MKELEKYTFGKKLASEIKKTGLTQAQFAEKVGVATPTLSYYYSGKRIPTIDTLVKMCSLLHCTPDYLLGYKTQAIPETIKEDSLLSIYKMFNSAGQNFIFAMLECIASNPRYIDTKRLDEIHEIIKRICDYRELGFGG